MPTYFAFEKSAVKNHLLFSINFFPFDVLQTSGVTTVLLYPLKVHFSYIYLNTPKSNIMSKPTHNSQFNQILNFEYLVKSWGKTTCFMKHAIA